MGTDSYPPEIRLEGDGILVSQSLAVYLVGHSPCSDEPKAESLIVIIEVEDYPLNEHVMRAVSSSITKLLESQAGVVGNASPNAK